MPTPDEEIQRLRDRVQELEELIGLGESDATLIRKITRAPPMACQVIGVLRKARSTMSGEDLFIALYGGRNEPDQPSDIRIIKVLVCKARAALAEFSIEIETTYGSGYSLTAAGKRKLSELMACGRQPSSHSLAA